MFKKLFGKKRSFRKMLTPVAAIVMLAQPAGNVIKAIPENIEINNGALKIDDDENNNGGYIVTLSGYCEKTDGQDLDTTEKKLIHVKKQLGKDEDFKFGVQLQKLNEEDKLNVFLKDPNGGTVMGRSTDGKAVVIEVSTDELKEVRDHIIPEYQILLQENNLLPVQNPNPVNPNLENNVDNELNPLLNNPDDGDVAQEQNQNNPENQGQNQNNNGVGGFLLGAALGAVAGVVGKSVVDNVTGTREQNQDQDWEDYNQETTGEAEGVENSTDDSSDYDYD